MLTREIERLPLNTVVRLYVQVNPRSNPVWQRVGTVTRVTAGVSAVFDAEAGHVSPLWATCTGTSGPGAPVICAVRFGVFEGRRGMTVISRGWVTRPDADAARRLARTQRRTQRGLRGVGPRGLRSGWPQM